MEGGMGFHSCFACFFAQWTNIMMCEDGRSEYLPHVCGHPPAFTTTRGGVRHLAGSTSGTSPPGQ